MNSEDRSAFAAAFIEAVRPDDAQGQSAKRMLMVAGAVVLAVALSALVFGVFGKKGGLGAASAYGASAAVANGQPGPSASTVPSLRATAGSGLPGEGRWTAVAGPTCDAGRTSFSTVGYAAGPSSDPAAGWSTWRSGGYRGGGCGGGFLSVPMSGQARVYDTSRFALWTFDFRARFTTADCQLATYVPDSPSLSSVGGNPTYYNYYETSGAGDAPLGSYQVDQISHRGSWVTDGSFEVTTGLVTVKLLDAGQTSVGARHAAAQVRITCQGA
jgi:hypothetical protein